MGVMKWDPTDPPTPQDLMDAGVCVFDDPNMGWAWMRGEMSDGAMNVVATGRDLGSFDAAIADARARIDERDYESVASFNPAAAEG